uniref:Triple QxxK/R motif-containing protein n=1 Tax=Oncorhynchus mykiss TaxID=8022 RepID=A0A8K9X983_ONCMY
MGRKDACATMAPVDQYRKQIGKQDYKKTKSALKLTKLKAEAKKSAPGIRVCMSHPPLCDEMVTNTHTPSNLPFYIKKHYLLTSI